MPSPEYFAVTLTFDLLTSTVTSSYLFQTAPIICA